MPEHPCSSILLCRMSSCCSCMSACKSLDQGQRRMQLHHTIMACNALALLCWLGVTPLRTTVLRFVVVGLLAERGGAALAAGPCRGGHPSLQACCTPHPPGWASPAEVAHRLLLCTPLPCLQGFLLSNKLAMRHSYSLLCNRVCLDRFDDTCKSGWSFCMYYKPCN